MEVPITDLDYVKLFAEKLKNDNRLFVEQKKFIESQIKMSSSLFQKMFAEDFKTNARKYFRKRKIIE